MALSCKEVTGENHLGFLSTGIEQHERQCCSAQGVCLVVLTPTRLVSDLSERSCIHLTSRETLPPGTASWPHCFCLTPFTGASAGIPAWEQWRAALCRTEGGGLLIQAKVLQRAQEHCS